MLEDSIKIFWNWMVPCNGCFCYTSYTGMSINFETFVVTVEWGKICWRLIICFSYSIIGINWNINCGFLCYESAINVIQWHWEFLILLLDVPMVECAKYNTTYWKLEDLFFLFWTETVYLATQQEYPVLTLWRQLIPMVIILNHNIVLDLSIQDKVSMIQKLYCMLTSIYCIYYCFFGIEVNIMGWVYPKKNSSRNKCILGFYKISITVATNSCEA